MTKITKYILRILIVFLFVVLNKATDLNQATFQLNQAAFNVGIRRNTQDTQYLNNLYNQANGQQGFNPNTNYQTTNQFVSSNQFVPTNPQFQSNSLVGNAFNPSFQDSNPYFVPNSQFSGVNNPTNNFPATNQNVPPFPSPNGALQSGTASPYFSGASQNILIPNSNLLLKNRK